MKFPLPKCTGQDERILALLVLDAQDLAQVLCHDLVHLLANQLSYSQPSQVNNHTQAPVRLITLPLNIFYALT